MSKMISARINDSLEQRMDRFPEVNWSEIMRIGIEEYLKRRNIT